MKQVATRRRLILIIAAGVVLIAAALLIWNIFFAVPRIPKSIVVVSGRIEGDDSAVASKTSGRILEVRVREGDTVNAGDTIAILDDAQIRARRTKLAMLFRRRKRRAWQRKSKSPSSRNNCSKADCSRPVEARYRGSCWASGGRSGNRSSGIGSATGGVSDCGVRQGRLYASCEIRGVSERQGLQASTTADQQAAVVAASKRRVEASQGALTTAEASLSNPSIRESQVGSVRRRIAQQEAEVASATAQTEQARAELAEAGTTVKT